MLLLGPPGIGKTHFAREVAHLLGTGLGFISHEQPDRRLGAQRVHRRNGRAHGRARSSRRWSTASTPTR
jgi:Mg-chelatase subunit ChlI